MFRKNKPGTKAPAAEKPADYQLLIQHAHDTGERALSVFSVAKDMADRGVSHAATAKNEASARHDQAKADVEYADSLINRYSNLSKKLAEFEVPA